MKNFIGLLILVGSALFIVAAHGKASTDLSALDDATRSLVMKEKMRASSFNGGKEQTNQGNDSLDPTKKKNTSIISGGVTTGCDINIGNTNPKAGSNTKPTTVIITGPVIQLPGKDCK